MEEIKMEYSDTAFRHAGDIANKLFVQSLCADVNYRIVELKKESCGIRSIGRILKDIGSYK